MTTTFSLQVKLWGHKVTFQCAAPTIVMETNRSEFYLVFCVMICYEVNESAWAEE